MSDEDAIIYLSQLRQIGRWSAEMILLFTYNRPNIWPIQDIGLLRAISKNFDKKYLPPESYVKYLNKRFSPYCSVATWYLWRSIDPILNFYEFYFFQKLVSTIIELFLEQIFLQYDQLVRVWSPLLNQSILLSFLCFCEFPEPLCKKTSFLKHVLIGSSIFGS